jgi:predicted amidohydrolase
MRITVARVPPLPGPEAVPERARELAEAAAAAGAALLLLPQRFAAGWARDVARLEAAAEPSDGPTASAMREVARETGLALAYGYVERCTGRCYDSLLLLIFYGYT